MNWWRIVMTAVVLTVEFVRNLGRAQGAAEEQARIEADAKAATEAARQQVTQAAQDYDAAGGARGALGRRKF